MKLDLTDLPVGECGLSPKVVDDIWATLGASLQRTGVEEFRREQREIMGRVAHNGAGAVLTSYGKEVATVLPIEFSKVAVALVHLMENARVNAAMNQADRDPGQRYVSLDDVIADESTEVTG